MTIGWLPLLVVLPVLDWFVCFDDFEPKENSFAKIPKTLFFDINGYLHKDIEAEYMSLPGLCRLCGSQVPSYLIDVHVLE